MTLVDRFWAESEDGARYEVLVYQHAADPFSTGRKELRGANDYRLRDGRDLDPISGEFDEFTLVETGAILRRIDDDAASA
jgi:hypothetical protein